MSSKTKSTKMEVLAKTDTPEILTKLESEIAKLKDIESAPWKTSGVVDGFSTNIHDEKNIKTLIKMMSAVLGRETAYNNAQDFLGRKSAPAYDMNGANASQIKDDINLRIDIIEHKDKLEKLKGFKDKMTSFLSQQEQKEMLLNEMKSYLSND